MIKVIVFLLLLTIATMTYSQVDPIEKSFNTSADTVFGVLTGILTAFGVGAATFFGIVFIKMFNRYGKSQVQTQTSAASSLETLVDESKKTNEKMDKLIEVQSDQGLKLDGHGVKIDDIEKKVTTIQGELQEVKIDIHKLKNPEGKE